MALTSAEKIKIRMLFFVPKHAPQIIHEEESVGLSSIA